MTEEEVYQGVKRVLTHVSTVDPDDIRKSQKLKIFVPPYVVLKLALAVDRQFPPVDLTDLVNALYDPIVTVGDLVGYILEVYSGDGATDA